MVEIGAISPGLHDEFAKSVRPTGNGALSVSRQRRNLALRERQILVGLRRSWMAQADLTRTFENST